MSIVLSTSVSLGIDQIMNALVCDGTVCPACGEEASEGNGFDYTTTGMIEVGVCSECGATWQASLGYQGIFSVSRADKTAYTLPKGLHGGSPLRAAPGLYSNRNKLRIDVLSDMRMIVEYFKNPEGSRNPRLIAEAAARLDKILPEG